MQQSGAFHGGQPRTGVVRLVNLALGALAGAVVTFWGLRLWAGSAPAPWQRPAVPELYVDAQALARALGAEAAPVAAAQAALPAPAVPVRYVLQGVLAGQDSGAGAAVIAVGNAAARPFRVGAAVDDALVLQSLSTYEARLGTRMDGPAAFTLRLTLPEPAAIFAQPPRSP